MKISSEAIQKKEFHIVFKGYKPEEVDDFLDTLAVEFGKMDKKILELQDSIDKLKFEGDKESVEMKNVIQEALVSAHQVADGIKAKAKEEADKMVNTKKLQQDEEYGKLISERKQLEENIVQLKTDYSHFKHQITKLTEDFREKTTRIDEEKPRDIPEAIKEDVNPLESKTELELDLENKPYEIKRGIEEETTLEKEIENETPIERSIDEASTEEVKAKLEKSEEKEADKIKNEVNEMFGNLKNEADSTDKPKINRKKIDIANPDIINDFFKTDED